MELKVQDNHKNELVEGSFGTALSSSGPALFITVAAL
jgi:hypothetical protein